MCIFSHAVTGQDIMEYLAGYPVFNGLYKYMNEYMEIVGLKVLF